MELPFLKIWKRWSTKNPFIIFLYRNYINDMAYCHVLGKDEHSILIGPFIIEQLLTSEIMFWFQYFFRSKRRLKSPASLSM